MRPKPRCTCCDRIPQEPAHSRPIDRALAGPGLLAHVLVSKYSDHLPLYRQSGNYARKGVGLDGSTLADWAGGASRALQPLVNALQRYMMAARKLHGHDTPVPVLAPGNGRTRTGRLWTYVRDDRPAGDSAAPAVWFSSSADRKGEHPQKHLLDFRGTLQADGDAGFNRLYEDGRIQEAACWTRARRKFYELHQAHASPVAEESLKRIGQLYEIESEIRGRPPDERALRAVALGRKNYLFAGTDSGGEREAQLVPPEDFKWRIRQRQGEDLRRFLRKAVFDADRASSQIHRDRAPNAPLTDSATAAAI